MESYESKHSDHSFTAKLAAKLGVTQRPLRLDSQAKYGEPLAASHTTSSGVYSGATSMLIKAGTIAAWLLPSGVSISLEY